MTRAERSEIIAEALSDREHNVFCLLAAGATVAEVARLLSISHSAARMYRRRIFRKLHVRSIADLAVMAFRAGLRK